jgi:hypothetical protein
VGGSAGPGRVATMSAAPSCGSCGGSGAFWPAASDGRDSERSGRSPVADGPERVQRASARAGDAVKYGHRLSCERPMRD